MAAPSHPSNEHRGGHRPDQQEKPPPICSDAHAVVDLPAGPKWLLLGRGLKDQHNLGLRIPGLGEKHQDYLSPGNTGYPSRRIGPFVEV